MKLTKVVKRKSSTRYKRPKAKNINLDAFVLSYPNDDGTAYLSNRGSFSTWCCPLSDDVKTFTTLNRAKSHIKKLSILSEVGKSKVRINQIKDVVIIQDGFCVENGKVKKVKCATFPDFCLVPLQHKVTREIFSTAKQAVKDGLKDIKEEIKDHRRKISDLLIELKNCKKELQKAQKVWNRLLLSNVG